jgi:dTDP-4-amino-4,6-dideoxygalactose transaminase
VDKYTRVDVGSSYLSSNILAAYLYAQLEARERVMEVIWEFKVN